MERIEIQEITLGLALAGIFAWSWWAWRNRERWLYAVAPLIWLLHVALFYATVLVVNPVPGTELFTTWSAVLRMHAVFLVMGAGIIMGIRHDKRTHH